MVGKVSGVKFRVFSQVGDELEGSSVPHPYLDSLLSVVRDTIRSHLLPYLFDQVTVYSRPVWKNLTFLFTHPVN